MTSEGLGEMFKADSADTCTGKFLLTLMGGRVEGLACADPGAPIGMSGIQESVFGFCTKIYLGVSGKLLKLICVFLSILALCSHFQSFCGFGLELLKLGIDVYN
jgi:hypothetical protein